MQIFLKKIEKMNYAGQFTKEFFGLRAKRFQSGRHNVFTEEINKKLTELS